MTDTATVLPLPDIRIKDATTKDFFLQCWFIFGPDVVISYAYRSIRARSSPIKKAANKLFTIEIRNEDVAGESRVENPKRWGSVREPRGFGFIQYFDPEDASDAKYHMDGKMLLGREIVVVFAEENRKKPSDMRAREKNKWQRPFLLWEVALKVT
ncbi:Serine/arginine-rich SC35-like splicing factor SCL33 [Zea mays]|uniref:Serine/arginine-rich SC35-like splicing factor SCL33 n=1 Tax=Zea mays TaxID=4577 RepID=A0A1D6NEN3_MAIZE|nr:Serine/arginine-rich SC35-like splicing factor SCL33 [Zea mays]